MANWQAVCTHTRKKKLGHFNTTYPSKERVFVIVHVSKTEQEYNFVYIQYCDDSPAMFYVVKCGW